MTFGKSVSTAGAANRAACLAFAVGSANASGLTIDLNQYERGRRLSGPTVRRDRRGRRMASRKFMELTTNLTRQARWARRRLFLVCS